MNADQATDKLDAAITAYDYKQIGAQLYRLRQALYNLRVDLGIVRDLADLKSEPPPNLARDVCRNCGGAITYHAHNNYGWRHNADDAGQDPIKPNGELCGNPEPAESQP